MSIDIEYIRRLCDDIEIERKAVKEAIHTDGLLHGGETHQKIRLVVGDVSINIANFKYVGGMAKMIRGREMLMLGAQKITGELVRAHEKKLAINKRNLVAVRAFVDSLIRSRNGAAQDYDKGWNDALVKCGFDIEALLNSESK